MKTVAQFARLVVIVFSLTPLELLASPLPVTAVVKQRDGLLLRMNPGTLKLQVCSDRIVHVVYSPTNKPPHRQSFVVTATWPRVPFKVEENANWIGLRTKRLQVRVARTSGAVTFLDANGGVILQELPGGGKTMTPAEVNHENTFHPEQSFVSPSDEMLYGLGQYQDGLWNWRGVPLQLRQNNTQIALPMLVSSKGYGLLWDNASFTEFNPVRQEVPLAPAPDSTTNLVHKTGAFTSGAAGEYVFLATDGNCRGDFVLKLDGQEVDGLRNYWTPHTLTAVVSLPANKTCALDLLGGGPEGRTRIFAGPRGDTTTFRSEVGEAIDYWFFYGPELDDVIAGYRLATGPAPLLPKWAYGYWQCRERYSSQTQIVAAASEFRRHQIPVDVIVQDWKYWGKYGWGAYQFDEAQYPDPPGMIKAIHDWHLAYMISVWSNPSGDAGQDLATNQCLVPGSKWHDPFSPKAREIRWKHLKQNLFDIGVDAWWQDATEPSDTGDLLSGKTVALGSGNRYRNAYPLFANRAVYEGQRAATQDKRVCILSRSAYPGQQRYATVCWSGDVSGDWDNFRRQIPAGLNFSIAGIPYWTTDTGGFWRPADQMTSAEYQEVLIRWFQWSTFCPILRMHGGASETEIWKWPESVQTNLLAYDRLRYRLLPYNYSVAWRVTNDGYSFLRPLVMDFRHDARALEIGNEYMFGPAFLVSPVTQPNATNHTVYLPAGTDWYDFWTGRKIAGGGTVRASVPLETIPVFVRAGSIVPLGPPVQYATEKPADPIELRVYRGADGALTLYEDEGDNYNYERGRHATIPISWNEKRRTLTLGTRTGEFRGMLKNRAFHIVWVSPGHGVGGEHADNRVDAEVKYRGESVTVRCSN